MIGYICSKFVSFGSRRWVDLSNLKHVFFWALLSRCALIVICIVSEVFIPDHAASGVTYFHALPDVEGREVPSFDVSWPLSAFVKWDSAHFLSIAQDGYTQAAQRVFQPLVPAAINFIAHGIGQMRSVVGHSEGSGSRSGPEGSVSEEEQVEMGENTFFASVSPMCTPYSHRAPFWRQTCPFTAANDNFVLSGVLLSIVCFAVSATVLCVVLKEWGKQSEHGENKISSSRRQWAIGVYLLSPALVFSVQPYSESVFALLSWSAMWLLTRAQTHRYNRINGYVLIHTPPTFRDMLCQIAVMPLLVLVSCTRSTGMFLAIFGASRAANMGCRLWAALTREKEKNTKEGGWWSSAVESLTLLLMALLGIAQVLASVLPVALLDAATQQQLCSPTGAPPSECAKWILWDHNQGNLVQALCFEHPHLPQQARHALKAVLSAVWSSPVSCVRSIFAQIKSGNVSPTPAYSYLQAKYWGVGLCSQWELRQVPNLLLGVPVLLLALHSLVSLCKSSMKEEWNGAYLSRATHLGAHIAVLIFFAHVQVSTRVLLHSCPDVLLGLAGIAHRSLQVKEQFGREGEREVKEQQGGEAQGVWGGKRMEVCLLWLGLLYAVAGVVLHVNFYPWT